MNQFATRFYLFTITLSCVAASTARLQADEPDWDQVREYLTELVDRDGLSGISASLIVGDQDPVSLAIGVDAAPSPHPLTPHSRMFAGSAGKTFFAAMAHDLERRGKLRLTDRIVKYLDDEALLSQVPQVGEIRLIHLLRHESGLPRYVLLPRFWEDVLAAPDRQWMQGEQLSYIEGMEPLHEPAQGWAYSDTNYILLGLVLEQVAQQSAYEYIEDHLLKPLELGDIVPSDRRDLPGLVEGKSVLFGSLGIPARPAPDGVYVFNPAFEWGGGGYIGTSRDLARWAKAFYSGEAMPGDYLDRLKSAAVPAPGLGPDHRYAPGAMLRETELGEWLGHDGVFPGYLTTLGYFSELDLAVAVQVPTDSGRDIGTSLFAISLELARLVHER